MKYVKCLFFISAFIMLLFCNTSTALASDIEFETEIQSEEDMESIIKYRAPEFLIQEPSKKAIKCFDVNEKGDIAISFTDLSKDIICVYSADGNFQYGYSCRSNGTMGIEWQKDLLNVCFFSSNYILSFDSNGNVIGGYNIPSTRENDSYWHKKIMTEQKEVNGKIYTLKNDIPLLSFVSNSYPILFINNENGDELIFYDVSEDYYVNFIIIFGIVLFFITVVVFGVVKEFYKVQKKKG